LHHPVKLRCIAAAARYPDLKFPIDGGFHAAFPRL
jgi:hypothetical protein